MPSQCIAIAGREFPKYDYDAAVRGGSAVRYVNGSGSHYNLKHYNPLEYCTDPTWNPSMFVKRKRNFGNQESRNSWVEMAPAELQIHSAFALSRHPFAVVIVFKTLRLSHPWFCCQFLVQHLIIG